jgi:ABC-type xylose transport system permease subunit
MTDYSTPSSNTQQERGWSALPNSVRVTLLRLIALALIVITLSLTSEAFLTSNNVLNVLRQTALLFLLAF